MLRFKFIEARLVVGNKIIAIYTKLIARLNYGIFTGITGRNESEWVVDLPGWLEVIIRNEW